MTTLDIPSGCKVTWDEQGTKVLVRAFHQLLYMVWRGTDLEFIKRIMTLQEIDMAEIRQSYAQAT